MLNQKNIIQKWANQLATELFQKIRYQPDAVESSKLKQEIAFFITRKVETLNTYNPEETLC